MVQILDKLIECPLEVDVVFPQRVVGIDDQELACHLGTLGARRNGISITASTSTGWPLRNAGSKFHLPMASAALRSNRSSRCTSTCTESTCPSARITAARRTLPSMRSAITEG